MAPTRSPSGQSTPGIQSPSTIQAAIGRDAKLLVKRHGKVGNTHEFPWETQGGDYFDVSKNTNITVGCSIMPINVRWQEYGVGLCPGALMSLLVGNARFYCCDQVYDSDNVFLFSSAQNLPPGSGPPDKVSWNRCLRASRHQASHPNSKQNKSPNKYQNASDKGERARAKKKHKDKKAKAKKKK